MKEIKMKKIKFGFLCTFALFSSNLAHATDDLICKAPGAGDVTIHFDVKKMFGREVDCINGDFVADLSGCAPNGAYSLHAPTGDAAMVAIVDRPQDYAKHMGGIMSHYVNQDHIYFAGGFNDPAKGYKDDWIFDVDRGLGKANAVIKKKNVQYNCEKAPKKKL